MNCSECVGLAHDRQLRDGKWRKDIISLFSGNITLCFQMTAKCSAAQEVLQSVTIYIPRYQLSSDQ